MGFQLNAEKGRIRRVGREGQIFNLDFDKGEYGERVKSLILTLIRDLESRERGSNL